MGNRIATRIQDEASGAAIRIVIPLFPGSCIQFLAMISSCKKNRRKRRRGGGGGGGERRIGGRNDKLEKEK